MLILKSQFFRIFPIVLIIAISTNNSFPQSKYNFDTLSDDLKEIAKQPERWDTKDLFLFMGIPGLTYGTMFIDEEIRTWVLNNQGYKNSIPIEFGRIWGEPWATLAIGGSFYIHGITSNNTANKKLGFEIGESALYTSLITILLKYSFGRERPRENSNPFSFFPFSFRNENYLALNSGHTALAFSLSTVLAKNIENDYLKIIMYLPAVLTGFSRIYQNHHWTSDVLLGGIIGYTVAEFVTNIHKTKNITDPPELMNQVKLFDFRIPL